jgi:hypothetical protein
VIKKGVKFAAVAAPAAAPRDPAAQKPKIDAYCFHFFSATGCHAKDACRYRHYLTTKEKEAVAAVNPPPPRKSD